ncbi:MAG: glycerol-3-phosphate 1-O-acyltransferase PlsY [Candidatus Mcinerneyibacterium aminivorans]|uniref:Glycerol-3-phosphate acyltransferase n=1 Tax=Candidatus Mcinerneyibacterium aminivorans TaxID=2703815 RepID=A0A5D0MH36_9BACT|nr:MAG: glycerol-3-phosphate 1-O-acyltransferase PlsY [Candidatus Mcinerneyibacterium aminivorans]
MEYIIVGILSYLLGAVPFSFLSVKVFSGEDIREHGSGNVGATNAYRIIGKYAIIPFLFDIAKGFCSVYFISQVGGVSPYFKVIAAITVIVGHVYSVFLKFDGGKGAATGLGVIIALSPLGALTGLVVWAAVLLLSRISSFATLITAVYVSIFSYLAYPSQKEINIFISIMVIFIVFTHKSNIKRLIRGEEKKIF